MENLQNLLNSVNAILREEKVKKEESLRRGERFNVFQICGVDHYEVKHSAIIARILDPQGNHGQKDKFLKIFLQTIKDSTGMDTSSCRVNTEYVTNEGRIDILIEDKKGKGVIIENKVYASDQSEQLKRYDKFSKEKYRVGQYTIYYLTLDEHYASDDSGEGINYTRISYKEHILNWIGECIKESATTPLIRETLIQYRNHIKQLTNQDMDKTNKEKLLEILKRNLSEAVNILSVESEIRKEVRRKYIETVLNKIAKKLGFSIGSEIEDFVNLVGNSFISFYIEEYKKYGSFVLRLDPYRGYLWLYYGIMGKEIIKDTKGEKIWNRELDNFPFGYEYCSNSYWDRNSTIIQMQKEIEMEGEDYPEGTIAKEIEDQLILIQEKDLFGKLKKMYD